MNTVVRAWVAAALLLPLATSYAQEASGNKPNIVILLADDLGYRDIGCYDGPVKTPALDRLAAKGTRFTNFYSGCAVCSPSRATLLTGRHHIRTGIYSWIHEPSHRSHLLERETTVAEILKERGYETGHFGKWHLGLPYGKYKDKPTPDKHGFDYWFATGNNALPNHLNPTNFLRNGEPVGQLEGYSCQLVVDEAISWLGRRDDKTSPFFLNIWFHEPHEQLAAPDDLIDQYEGSLKSRTYSGTIDNTDRAIARLLKKLSEVAPLENTLVIYSSDNGSKWEERVGELKGKKGTNWEGGIRVPGIFYWPGKIPAGKTVDAPAGLVDVLPTICSLLGIDAPTGRHLDGSDIAPLLTGKEDDFNRHQPLFWHLHKSQPMVAMRDGNYSLVAEPDYELPTDNLFHEAWIPAIKTGGYKNFQLFDLSRDPGQETNLAETHPELLDALKRKMLSINASIMADGADWHLKGGETCRFLEAGEIMPTGWIREQMRLDLKDGYYGQYDKINHTVTHDLFTNQDRCSQERYEGMNGWWSGEHEGYWKDGVLRMAFLCGDEAYKKKAIDWLDEIVAAQGDDGYIGIYKGGSEPNARFNHLGENGELWTQSRIFQVLIAGYEFTGNENYFTALRKAVDLTIAKDPGNYFNPEQKAVGGTSHGIGFFDTLWYLHNKTGEQKYADFALKLYRDFNNSPVRDDDLQTQKLLSDEKIQKHGAHIAEGFFVPHFIASISDDPDFDRAAARALPKLKYHLTPSGAMVCDENVKGNPGSSKAAYEYCGIAEMVQSLTKIVALTGNPEAADIAESMTLNAGQGVRLPVLTALAYLSFDNRIDSLTESPGQCHAYSVLHAAAACCALNGGRLLPYYVEGMWMRSDEGLVAQLYGPCTIETTINDVPVRIEEDTSYPFSNRLKITVTPERPVAFPLSFRIPPGAVDATLSGISETRREGAYLVIERTWQSGDSFELVFDFPVRRLKQVADAEMYIKRGPLVYALPFEHEMSIASPTDPAAWNAIQPDCGFHAYDSVAIDSNGWDYCFMEEEAFTPLSADGDMLHPWADPPLKLKGQMSTAQGKPVTVELVPIGCTVLRRTTFPMERAAP